MPYFHAFYAGYAKVNKKRWGGIGLRVTTNSQQPTAMSNNMFKGYKYQKLFNHMYDEYDIIMCQDEMRQIVEIVHEEDKANIEREEKENQQPTANSQQPIHTQE